MSLRFEKILKFMVFRLPENEFLIQIEFFSPSLRQLFPQVHIIIRLDIAVIHVCILIQG